MPIWLHLRIRSIPGRHGELVEFLREAVPHYEAPGGIRVSLLQAVDDHDSFVEVVEYADEAAYRRDQERVETEPAMLALLERWRSILAEPPEMTVYRDRSTEILRAP